MGASRKQGSQYEPQLARPYKDTHERDPNLQKQPYRRRAGVSVLLAWVEGKEPKVWVRWLRGSGLHLDLQSTQHNGPHTHSFGIISMIWGPLKVQVRGVGGLQR